MDRREAFGLSIKKLRKERSLTQPELADRLEGVPGLRQADISKIENGRHSSPEMHIAALARALGVRSSDISIMVDEAVESGGRDYPIKTPLTTPEAQERTGGDCQRRSVPLVGWVSAGHWDQVENPFDPEVAKGLVPVGIKVSDRAYALKVKGDSMTNPIGWPSFPEGSTIIVDPIRQYSSGDLVIAQVDDDDEATFKRLVKEAGTMVFVPLNPRYQTITVTKPVHICGVVVAMAEKEI